MERFRWLKVAVLICLFFAVSEGRVGTKLGALKINCSSNQRFFPEKATSLAVDVLDELVKIIQGNCEAQIDLEKYKLIRDCISGHIYDSSPVDFTSDLGTKFVLHPTVLKMSEPPRLLSWLARGFTSGLDALFLTRFEAQRAEYWQTLYSSVNMGPFLILCSEDDDIAPYQVICNFAQRLQDLGGDVKLLKWNSSPHVEIIDGAFLGVLKPEVHRHQERTEQRKMGSLHLFGFLEKKSTIVSNGRVTD